ncbi:MAG: hypothetical protein DMF06_05225 [Verrucomicrobia bacterium]|nr:MAG: hypothetical protein DMF06_05225 [Verrucomicrobiota bacterium]
MKPLVVVDLDKDTAKFIDSAPSDADFIVVVPLTVPLLFADNLIGACAACGLPVQMRPENKQEQIPLVCMPCVPAWAAAAEKPQ